MATDHASQVVVRRRRYWLALKVLLGFNALLLGLFVLSRLTPSQGEKLGPWGQSLYELFNPPAVRELNSAGRGLVAEVKALGGERNGCGARRDSWGSAAATRFTSASTERSSATMISRD